MYLKKICFCLIFAWSIFPSLSQIPQAVKYQAVIRDNNGDIVTSQNISLKISFLKGSTSGVVVYSESHATSTNEFGLVNVAAGSGTVISGDFTAIDWGEDIYFMKTEADPAGGNNYELLGISQVLAVPYSLYAEEAENVVYSDTSATNELQTLFLNGDTLFISETNYVLIPKNNDNDSLNEIQQITRDSLVVSLSKNGGSVSVADNDNNPVNELQMLSLINDTLSLSQGNSVNLNSITSIYFPDGIAGDYICRQIGSGYIIPQGKNFYLFTASGISTNWTLLINGNDCLKNIDPNGTEGVSMKSPMIIGEGDTLGGHSSVYFTGIEVEAKTEAIDTLLLSGYAVPSGKTLFIHTIWTPFPNYDYIETSSGQRIFQIRGQFLSLSNPIIIKENTEINSLGGGTASMFITGYLK